MSAKKFLTHAFNSLHEQLSATALLCFFYNRMLYTLAGFELRSSVHEADAMPLTPGNTSEISLYTFYAHNHKKLAHAGTNIL
jgi:hypothetical protein